jgi:hypothetical protein
MLDLTIETVSRQLGELETMGAIARDGARRIELLALRAVGETGEPGPAWLGGNVVIALGNVLAKSGAQRRAAFLAHCCDARRAR